MRWLAVVGSATTEIFLDVFNHLHREWTALRRPSDGSTATDDELRTKFLGRQVALQDGRKGTVRDVEQGGSLIIEVTGGKLVRLRTRLQPQRSSKL